MRKGVVACVVGAGLISLVAGHLLAQGPAANPGGRIPIQQPAAALNSLDDGLLQWPLPANDKAYGAIDGHHLHQFVRDQTAISRKYRDAGHPQFWGRIIGTSADDDSRAWLIQKFTQIGLSDVHVQSFDM